MKLPILTFSLLRLPCGAGLRSSDKRSCGAYSSMLRQIVTCRICQLIECNEHVILLRINMGKTTHSFFRSFSQEWLLFAVASLVLGVMFAYMVYFRHELIMDREKEQLVHAAAVAEVMIGDQLDKIRITLDNIRASLEPGWEDNGYAKLYVKERLSILASAMTSVRSLSIFDAQGTVIASNQEHFIGKSYAYRDYFRIPEPIPCPIRSMSALRSRVHPETG